MDFELSADQKLLLDTVSSFAKRESPVSRLRSLREDPVGWQRPIWKRIGDLGWLAIALPEEAGGLGGSFVDAAIVLEQLGATLVPEPYVPTLLAATAIARRGDEAQRERFLAPALAGDESLAFAWAEDGTRFSASSPKVLATATPDGFTLSGTKVFVDNGHAADRLVVTARGEGSATSLFVVDPKAPGVTVHAFPTIDGHRAARIRFDDVKLGPDARLGDAGTAAALVSELLDLGAAAACAEAVGVMRTVLAMTCDYLRTREQFGVKIGSFQALAHRAVDMFVETELSRSITMIASLKVSSTDPVERMSAISAAKAQIFESGRFVTQQAIQLHGGIGVTDEHDIGLYFKRMHVLMTAFGDEEHHVGRFASLPSFLMAPLLRISTTIVDADCSGCACARSGLAHRHPSS
jgi:alkylation response protein AidB-like acyl-CoA dehydrogenase